MLNARSHVIIFSRHSSSVSHEASSGFNIVVPPQANLSSGRPLVHFMLPLTAVKELFSTLVMLEPTRIFELNSIASLSRYPGILAVWNPPPSLGMTSECAIGKMPSSSSTFLLISFLSYIGSLLLLIRSIPPCS